MEYAVVEYGGNQYKVKPGDIIEVERMNALEGGKYLFERVLLHVSDGNLKVGTPLISGVSVESKVLGHIKADKVRVSQFKAKSRHRRTIGFRHALTKVEIVGISGITSQKSTVRESKSAPRRRTK